jgi:hypothetical protein
MSLTPEQEKEAREHAVTLRRMQRFATSISTSPAATPYEKEMARTLMHHAYKAETEAALLGGES